MASTFQNLANFEHPTKKSPQENRQRDLFRIELSRIVDPAHGLIKLASVVDWDRLDELFGSTYHPDKGRPAVSTRLMVALHYLKYTFTLSDEEVVEGRVENPRWQCFSGTKSFEHEAAIDPSSKTRRRKRIGEAGAEELLTETIHAGLKLKAAKPHAILSAVGMNFHKLLRWAAAVLRQIFCRLLSYQRATTIVVCAEK